jgi:hypothetical protein
LIFGGYDASLLDSQKMIASSFSVDNDRDLLVRITGIDTEGTSLLPDGDIAAFIDSSVPHIVRT